jgi:GAF domain-containing protein
MNQTTQPPITDNNLLPENWRDHFLQRILIVASIIGIFAVIPAVLSTNNIILQGIYIGAFVILVASIIIRLPYTLKSGLFVALPLILGISSLSETGIRGDSLFFLLAFVTLTTLLIGSRGGIGAVALTEIIIIVAGFLILNDLYNLSDKLAIEGDISDWVSAGVTQLLISVIIMSGLQMLQAGFRQAQIQNEAMVNTLRASQLELEKHVADRTKELARKTNQLNAATFVAHQTAEIQELDMLLNSTVNLISKQFGFYHVAIYLINERGDYATLQATSSEGGKQLHERGYRLRVGTEGIVGFVAAEKKPRISLDVGEDAIFFDSPELPNTRSELSLPLIVRNKVIGVLDIQSSEIQAFNYDDIDIFQTLADQIAVAIDNVRLLTESKLIISQLQVLSSENTRLNWKTEVASRKASYHYSAIGVHPIEKPVTSDGINTLDVPLVLRGQRIGKISLQRKSDNQNWTSQEETVATEIAAQTALALENIRLVERTRERSQREQAIANITSRVRETLDLDTVLRVSAREIQQALDLQEAEVRLFPQDMPVEEKLS